jgi:hypothetical protein
MIYASIKILYKYFLVLLGILYIITPANISDVDKIFGFFFIVILIGAFLRSDVNNKCENKLNNINSGKLIFLVVIQFFCASYAISYYTGLSIINSISNIISGVSNYSLYQAYFSEADIGNLGIEKMPAILALASVKIIFLYCIADFVSQVKDEKSSKLIYITSLPIVLISLSRGTFFEIFELIVSYGYVFFLKKSKITKLHLILLGIALLFFIILFIINTATRFENFEAYLSLSCATSMYCFSPYGLNLIIEYAVYMLSGYFSMGLFFISKYLQSLIEVPYLLTILPFFGWDIFGFLLGGLETSLCLNKIDCNAVWMPQIISIISNIGLIATILAIYIVGIKITKIEILFLKIDIRYGIALNILLLIYLLSLPVGKFILVSSSNILSILFFALILGLKYIKNKYRKSCNIIKRRAVIAPKI